MRTIALVVALGAAFLLSTAAQGQEQEPPAPQPQPEAQQATVVRLEVKRPKAVIHRHARFAVPSWPTPSYVLGVIVPYEASLWGASEATLHRRISCESGGDPGAANGQYRGVGQFASGTFYRGMSTISSRVVRITAVKYRRMHSRVYRHWSDGRVTRARGRVRRQRVVMHYRGAISGGYPDTWSEVRIMAQANAGRSAVHDSEWQCR